MIVVQNLGPLVIGSNYWESDYARDGDWLQAASW